MRSPAHETVLDIRFDCELPSVKRLEIPGSGFLKMESLSVSVPKSISGTVAAPAGINVLGINLEGAVIARTASVNRVIIVPPGSMFYVRGPVRLSSLAARGEHKVQMISWHSSALPALDQWAQSNAHERYAKGHYRSVGCKPIAPYFQDTIKRIDEARALNNELTEPLLISAIFEAVGRIMVGGDQMQLSPVPMDLPEPILRLAEAVRKNPAGSWSLKEASDMASYSPFHFSRVFKQLVGYGFHEYVDRCRTEIAVDMLVSSERPVDLVATHSGFGTTQGLRESVREYLGLVPSEFRSLPEGYETTPA